MKRTYENEVTKTWLVTDFSEVQIWFKFFPQQWLQLSGINLKSFINYYYDPQSIYYSFIFHIYCLGFTQLPNFFNYDINYDTNFQFLKTIFMYLSDFF